MVAPRFDRGAWHRLKTCATVVHPQRGLPHQGGGKDLQLSGKGNREAASLLSKESCSCPEGGLSRGHELPLQPGLKAQHRLRVDLASPGLRDPQHLADLLQRQPLVVIQANHGALLPGQR